MAVDVVSVLCEDHIQYIIRHDTYIQRISFSLIPEKKERRKKSTHLDLSSRKYSGFTKSGSSGSGGGLTCGEICGDASSSSVATIGWWQNGHDDGLPQYAQSGDLRGADDTGGG